MMKVSLSFGKKMKGFSDSIDGEGFQETKVLCVTIKGFSEGFL
jgi:hypothetical protein